MALTYTEIEQQKNTKVAIFFIIVLLFYFLVTLVVANASKFFFVFYAKLPEQTSKFLSLDATFNILLGATVVAVIHFWFSFSQGIPMIIKKLGILKADKSDRYHKRFETIVDEVNVATGSKYKITPMVIPTVAMNAFAISDVDKNAIIGVTEGLLSKLNRDQLQAVVAHEMAHVVSGDSFQTTIACSLFGIITMILTGVEEAFQGTRLSSRGKGSGGIIVLLVFVYLILRVMHFFYSLIRFALSRERELRADAIAIRLTRDPIALSEALYAIQIGWRGLGYIDESIAPLFIVNPLIQELDEKESFWSNLMSTHPPINKRLKILTDMAHASVENIKETIFAQQDKNAHLREMPAPEKNLNKWMFMDEKRNWQGPYTITQILALGWLKPDSWIKPINEKKLILAKDEPLLKPVFDEQMKTFTTSSHQCFYCKQPLVEEDYEGVTAERCLFCQGILIEKDKVSRIITRKEKGFDERVIKLASIAQQNGIKVVRGKVKSKEPRLINCPECNAHMIRGFYTLAYLIEVHKCAYCRRIWFDKDELEMLQYLIENKQAAKIYVE